MIRTRVRGGKVTERASRPAALASPALGLVWDFDNRLRGADTNGTPASQEVSFEYDALGRRVARSEAGNNVVYVHAGQQVIADYARGAAAAAPSFRYVYGSYVDEPLLRHAGTGTTLPTSGTAALYYHRNQQYSIVGLSDAAGALVERYAYTAYGELTILAPDRTLRATSSFENRYTYTGREWDATLSLHYFRARWLEPKAGRFIGRDPLGYVDGMGLYGAYFAIGDLDPFGLQKRDWQYLIGNAKESLNAMKKAHDAILNKIKAAGDNCVDLTKETEQFVKHANNYLLFLAELHEILPNQWGQNAKADELSSLPVTVFGVNLLTLQPHLAEQISGSVVSYGGANAAYLDNLDAAYNSLWYADKGCAVVGLACAGGAVAYGVKKGGAIVLCRLSAGMALGYGANRAACYAASQCGYTDQQIAYLHAASDLINIAIFKYRFSRGMNKAREAARKERARHPEGTVSGSDTGHTGQSSNAGRKEGFAGLSPEMQSRVNPSGRWNGGCAEPHMFDQMLKDGVNPYDTFSCAIGFKGDVYPPCPDSCKPLLRNLGVWAVEY